MRRSKGLVVSTCFVLLGACSSARSVIWRGTPYPALVDCSATYAEYFGKKAPVVPAALREKALVRAAKWAFDACYSPCGYPMCAAVTDYSNDELTLFITSDEWPRYDESSTSFLIKPEAEIVLSAKDFRVLHAGGWHPGCRWGEVGCKWPARFG